MARMYPSASAPEETPANVAEPRVVTAWHWLREPDKLRDGTPVRLGRLYRLPTGTRPRICSQGYHASEKLLDATSYAPGPWLTRVELSGTFASQEGHTDKLCASERRILWLMDATPVIRLFLADLAAQFIDKERAEGAEPHEDILNAIQVARDFVAGKASQRDLRIAQVLADDVYNQSGWRDRGVRYAVAAVSRKPVEQLRELRIGSLDESEREQLNATFEAMVLAVAPKPVGLLTTKQRWDRTQKLRKPVCKGNKAVAATLTIEHARDDEVNERLILGWYREVQRRQQALNVANDAEAHTRRLVDTYVREQLTRETPENTRTFNRELKKRMDAVRCAVERSRLAAQAYNRAATINRGRIYERFQALPQKQQVAIQAKAARSAY